jgi:hypothetical protein
VIRDFRFQCMVAGWVPMKSWIHVSLCGGVLLLDLGCDFGVFLTLELLFWDPGAHNSRKVVPGPPWCPQGGFQGGSPYEKLVHFGDTFPYISRMRESIFRTFFKV